MANKTDSKANQLTVSLMQTGAENKDIELSLKNAREKLLDLTLRNKLLNFKDSNRSIRVCDEIPDQIYRLLVIDQIAMEFLADVSKDVPSPDASDPGAAVKLLRSAAAGEEIFDDEVEEEDFLLPAPPSDGASLADRHTDSFLQTPLDSKHLQTRLLHIYYDASTVVQETGTNMLYLALGFLQWTEDKFNKKTSASAPLILIPVRLERGSVKTKFSLSWTAEDVDTNESLAVKLRELGVELPRLGDTEEIEPEKYFELVEQAIAEKKDWKIKREMVLGFFHFGKLRMYLDLDPGLWGGSAFFETHNVLGQMFGNSESEHLEVGEIEPDRAFDLERSPLVVDADSSQHAVILESVAGRNIVIEGPPGTGKSQTISNLIAGFLQKGKTVLFVAEKAAALDVVRDRLKDVGLGDFCLELHSHKANKQSVLQSLKSRMSRPKQSYPDLTSLHNQLRKQKKQLADYAGSVNESLGESGYTVNQAVGMHSQILLEYPQFRTDVPRMEDASQTSKETFENRRELLQRACASLANFSPISAHPLSGIESRQTMPGDEQKIGKYFSTLKQELQGLQDCFERLPFEFPEEKTINSVESLSKLISNVGAPPKDLPTDLIGFLSQDQAKQEIERGTSLSAEINSNLQKIGTLVDLSSLPENVDQLILQLKAIESKLPGLSWKNRTSLISNLHELSEKFARLAESVPAQWISSIAASENYDDSVIDGLLVTARIAQGLPPEIDAEIVSIVSSAENLDVVAAAIREKQSYDQTRDELNELLRLEDIDDDVESLARQLEDLASDFLVTLKLGALKGTYRKATARLRLLMKRPDTKIDLLEWSRTLRKFCRWEKHAAAINQNVTVQSILGKHYKGLSSRWDHFQAAIDWTCLVRSEERIPESFKNILLSEKVHQLTHLCTELDEIVKKTRTRTCELLDQITLLTGRPCEQLFVDANFNDRKTLSSELEGLVQTTVETICTFSKELPGTVSDWIPLIELAEETRQKRLQLERDAIFQELGTAFKCAATDWNILLNSADWLLKAGNLPGPVKVWLTDERVQSNWQTLSQWQRESTNSIDSILKKLADLRSNVPLSEETFFTGDFCRIPVDKLIHRLERVLSSLNELTDWAHLHSCLDKLKAEGLQPYIEGALLRPDFINTVVPRYELAFAESLLRTAHSQFPSIRDFRRSDHDSVRNQFQKLDVEMVQHSRALVASAAASRPVPAGKYGARVSELTEQHLIEHEIGKEKRHRPLRELIQRAGNAMMALKPVFMMSPMSVAQYLKPLHLQFDVLIMDEASQIRPECAFGAIARAKQVIVVGDTKQLPPTDFFQAEKTDEENEHTSTFEQLDSILEYSAKVFPSKLLKWHYRSKHQSLIAFSNAEYYDHGLMFVPSPSDDGRFGINWHPVEGVYDRGKSRKNRIEARAVAEAIINHARKHSKLSLGVGTLNRPQAEAIEEELEILRAEHPECENFFANKQFASQTEEPFFIKNLENIQGDERDVIIISIGFGKDQDGVLYQSFGPLIQDGGWRRLNVLVTRARQRIELFSSLRAEEIIVTPGRKMSGTAALKRYLAFAETKNLDQPYETGREPDSPFEEAVIRLLKREGYQVTPQLGVRGFYIDVAVHHPTIPGKYVMAVECDGATYHSLKSTRDRDRLREAALRAQGWKVHRIWSTSWFTDMEGERQRLLGALEEVIRSAS